MDTVKDFTKLFYMNDREIKKGSKFIFDKFWINDNKFIENGTEIYEYAYV